MDTAIFTKLSSFLGSKSLSASFAAWRTPITGKGEPNNNKKVNVVNDLLCVRQRSDHKKPFPACLSTCRQQSGSRNYYYLSSDQCMRSVFSRRDIDLIFLSPYSVSLENPERGGNNDFLTLLDSDLIFYIEFGREKSDQVLKGSIPPP